MRQISPLLWDVLDPWPCQDLANTKLIAIHTYDKTTHILLNAKDHQTGDLKVYMYGNLKVFGLAKENCKSKKEIKLLSENDEEILSVELVQAAFSKSDVTHFLLMLDKDGFMWKGGDHSYGDFYGDQPEPTTFIRIHVKGEKFEQIATGAYHCMALSREHKVFVWGQNSSYQLGRGNALTSVIEAHPKSIDLTDIIQIACGFEHCFAVTNHGKLKSWGRNDHGQLGLGSTDPAKIPSDVASLHNRVCQVSCGKHHTLILLKNGKVLACGKNQDSQLGRKDLSNSPVLEEVEGLPAEIFSEILAWEDIGLAKSTTGSYYIWGTVKGTPNHNAVAVPKEYKHLLDALIWAEVEHTTVSGVEIDTEVNPFFKLEWLFYVNFEEFFLFNRKLPHNSWQKTLQKITAVIIQDGKSDVNNLNASDHDTAFHLLAKYQHELCRKNEDIRKLQDRVVCAAIRALLEGACASWKCFNKDGYSPLHEAVRSGNFGAVKGLLENSNIDVNMGDETEKKTALHLVASSNNENIAKELLEKGCDIKMVDVNTRKPIHIAIERDCLGMLKLLYERKTSEHNQILKEDCSHKMTCCDLAIANKSWDCLRFILETVRFDTPCVKQEKDKVLHALASNKFTEKQKHKELIELVFEKCDYKRDMVKTRNQGELPLHTAAQHDCIVSAALFIDRCRDINAANKKGHTALHVAVKYGSLEVIDLLLRKGAVVGIQTVYDAIDAKINATEVVKMLLPECKKSLFSIDDPVNDETVLHKAVQKKKFGIVKHFIDYEAKVDALNTKEQTPMHLAAAQGSKDILEYLLKKCDSAELYSLGDHKKATILHIAAEEGHSEVVKMLIEKDRRFLMLDAENALQDEKGLTALDVAINQQHRKVVKAILKSVYWKIVLTHRFKNPYDDNETTPFRQLIKTMPDLAEIVLDYGITIEHRSKRKGADILCDFTCLKPSEKDDTNGHVLSLLKDHKATLKHPLVWCYLLEQQNTWWFFFPFLIFYLLLGALFTSFMMISVPRYNMSSASNGTDFIHDCQNISISFPIFPLAVQPGSASLKTLKIFCWTLSVIGFVLEFCQLWVNQAEYKRLWRYNILDFISYIFVCITITPYASCHLMYVWQWYIGIIGLFILYLNLFLFSRRLPSIGFYLLLVEKMTLKLAKYILACFPLLMAFDLLFVVMMQNQAIFAHPGFALVKVFTIMIGELDYAAIFHPEDETDALVFKGLPFILFVVFLIVCTTVIMNLLTSVAVYALEDIIHQAKEEKLWLLVKLILDASALAKKFPRLQRKLLLGKSEVKHSINEKIIARMSLPLRLRYDDFLDRGSRLSQEDERAIAIIRLPGKDAHDKSQSDENSNKIVQMLEEQLQHNKCLCEDNKRLHKRMEKIEESLDVLKQRNSV